jgi:uncharacterized membrane protein
MRLPLLILHVSAGILAMLAGALAIAFRKGWLNHRRTGNVFVICMLSVSAIGSYLGFMKGEMDNFTAAFSPFISWRQRGQQPVNERARLGSSIGLPLPLR